MAEAINYCGICSARQNYRPAVIWCQHCSEALCGGCKENHSLSKGTGNHSTIAIVDYQKLPTDVLKINDICQEHDDKYVMYCQNHLQPCCVSCNLENHKGCKYVVKLKSIIQNFKMSTALQEIEDSLQESNENLIKIEADRKNNLKSIETESRKALDEIEKVRRKINKHLDVLQDKIKAELKQKEEKTKKQILDTLTSLSKNKTFIDNNLQTLNNVRKYASDLQAFLYSAEIEKRAHYVETRLLDASTYTESKLNIKIEPFLERFANQLITFGTVEIKTSPSSIVLRKRKEVEAQLMITKPQTRKIEDINPTVDKTIDYIGVGCCGCCILTDGRMAFTNHFSQAIRLFNTNGTEKASIKTPGFAFDVTQVNDTTLAVSCPGPSSCLCLINTRTAKVIKSLLKGHEIHGITVHDEEHLIYCEGGKGICMICITDGTLTDIVKEKLPGYCYVTSFGDNVIHTNHEINTVTCHDISGKKKWSFKDESALREPHGIATDRHGNVFVAGRSSANIIILSVDGQKHKEVKCGLVDVYSLDYDKVNDKLLCQYADHKAVLMVTNF